MLDASCNFRWSTDGITILNFPKTTFTNGIYFDANDTLYIADETSNYVVWKLPKNASVPTIVAGTLKIFGNTSTLLHFPQDVCADSKGNLYINDDGNARVQKYASGSTTGVTIAGITGSPGSGLYQLNKPRGIWLDSTETYIYIADYLNHRIVRYLTNSTSGDNGTLIVGNGTASNSINGLNGPWGITSYPSVTNDLYITNVIGQSVIKWTIGASSGTFVAGTPGVKGSGPNFFNNPAAIKLDRCLNFYVVDYTNHRVQMFYANNQTGFTIAGTGVAGNASNQLNSPRGIAFDSAMNMYVSDTTNQRIQMYPRL